MNEGRDALTRGIIALDGARPNPSDDRRLRSVIELDVWIEMPDLLSRQRLQTLTVIFHVESETLSAMPSGIIAESFLSVGILWRAIGETRGQFDHRLVDENGDGVEVGGMGVETEALSFERNGAAACERIENVRELNIGEIEKMIGSDGRKTLNSVGLISRTVSVGRIFKRRAAINSAGLIALIGSVGVLCLSKLSVLIGSVGVNALRWRTDALFHANLIFQTVKSGGVLCLSKLSVTINSVGLIALIGSVGVNAPRWRTDALFHANLIFQTVNSAGVLCLSKLGVTINSVGLIALIGSVGVNAPRNML